MSIVDFIMKMPWQYVIITILFSLYYGNREILERINRFSKDTKNIPTWEKFIFYYFRDFIVQCIFTISGFIALFIANYIFSSLKSFNDISSGTAILLIFLIIWGITGVSGYLSYLIVSGKFMGHKTMH
jgi:hypothetical protein